MKSWMRAFYAGTLSVLLSMLGLSDTADAAEGAVQQQEEPQLSQILRAATTPPPPVKKQPPPLQAQHVEGLKNGRVLIHTPAIRQMPELRDGCEVTAMAMLLQALGHPASKMQLAAEVRKDPTPPRRDARGHITYWGNPNTGFVGAVNGRPIGYGVFHGPMKQLLDRHLPGQAVDMTGKPFEELLYKVQAGKPVVVWTTVPLSTTDQWTGWQTPSGPVRITWQEHAVLLVGYGPGVVYINDPFDGTARKRVGLTRFRASWEQLGRQAVTVK
ncbi:MAG: C39 family peptidase [Tumebacillaceae bacterium]